VANPQLEDGYFRIANEVLEHICKLDLTNREFRVFLAVLRLTWGFNKKQDKIALSQIAKMTGLQRSHCQSTLQKLVRRKMITVPMVRNRAANIISPNKDYELWQSVPTRGNCSRPQVQRVTDLRNRSVPPGRNNQRQKTFYKDKGVASPPNYKYTKQCTNCHEYFIVEPEDFDSDRCPGCVKEKRPALNG